jgi:16S rRNA pseudouridine516 synthase
MRLDRFICKHTEHGHQQAKRLVASGRVSVNGEVVTNLRAEIDRFMCVELDGRRLQQQQSHYLMLNKPTGYLSATSDPQHPTVLELVPPELRTNLHLAGRLDRATTGLLLLTNDGLWSRRITAPEQKIPKVYHVTTAEPIHPDAEACFAAGVWLAREGIFTSPAQLERISPCEAHLTIYEGRHHQVKRMFAAIGNAVTALHRESMGSIRLDPDLAPGQYRPLTATELKQG